MAAEAGQGRREGTSWASEGHPSAMSRPFVPLPDPCSEDTYSYHSADGTYRHAPVPPPRSGLTSGTPLAPTGPSPLPRSALTPGTPPPPLVVPLHLPRWHGFSCITLFPMLPPGPVEGCFPGQDVLRQAGRWVAIREAGPVPEGT